MIRKNLSRTTAALLCTSALLGASITPLNAQATKTGVDINVIAEAASNPLLDQSGTDIVPAGSIEIRPWLRTETATTTFDLQAFASLREFTSDYDSEDRYGGTAAINTQATERVSLFVRGGVFSSNARRGNLVDTGLPVLIEEPGFPALPVDPALGDDITVLGQNGRTTSWNVNAGGQIVASDRDTIGFGLGYQDLSLSDELQGQDYNSINADVSWQHRLAERTTVGVFGGARKNNFEDENNGDATTYSGGASLIQDLGSGVSLEVTGGVAHTEVDTTPLLPGRDFTTFTTQSALCQRNELRNLCLSYRRTPLPTSQGGVRNSEALNLSASQRLSERDNVSISGSYSRTKGTEQGPILIPQIEYADVRGRLNRRFNDQLDGFIFAGVSRLYRADIQNDAAINFGIGARIKLGARR